MFRPLTKVDKTKERILTMNTILSDALHEYHVLREQLDRALLGKDSAEWFEELKKFMRKDPSHAEGMIYIPLEWSADLGEVSRDLLQEYTDLYNKGHGGGWRLPIDKELSRALKKMKPDGFTVWKYYWSGTENTNGGGYTVTYTYNGMGGLGSMTSVFFIVSGQKYPHLRLCRPVKLPE
jgi:hypothetical protein